MALELTEEQTEAGWELGTLGDYLKFSNGRKSPGDNPDGSKKIWGSNGVIGHTDETNALSNTVVVGRVGAYCGSVAFSREKSWVTDNAIKGERKLAGDDARFWYYKLTSMNLSGYSHGTSQPLINQGILNSLAVSVPSQNERNRIAEILGSLDDKIEANNALMESLEQLADAEFLRLLKLHEGSIEDAKYGDFAVFGGGTPSTKKPEYWEGGVINWVTPTDVTGLSNHAMFESSRKITDAGLEACSSVLHPAGSILMTSRASIGFFAVNEVPAATNQGFIVVEPENADVRWWVYHHMKRDVGLFLQLSNGATFMELSRGMFKSLPLKLYRGKTALKDIHAQITSLAAENRELAETRNLLIRKLIR